MKTAVFDSRGVEDNPDALERRWNEWVDNLFRRGLQPADVPLVSLEEYPDGFVETHELEEIA